MVAASLLTLSACGSDDETPAGKPSTTETQVIGTKNVFPEGLPSVSSDYKEIVVDDKGRVTKIVDEDGESILFEYLDATRAPQQFDVIITIMEDGQVDSKLKCVLNKDGFVASVVQEYGDPEDDDDTWTFEYVDKYMTKMTRSEGDNEVTTITYNADHDITDVTVVDDDNDRSDIKIRYTGSDVKTALPNKGCIMLHDDTFDIDLDEMRWAYIAGLLGKATTHLPLSYICTHPNSSSVYTYTFKWTLNSDNMPVKMEGYDVHGNLDYTLTWKW